MVLSQTSSFSELPDLLSLYLGSLLQESSSSSGSLSHSSVLLDAIVCSAKMKPKSLVTVRQNRIESIFYKAAMLNHAVELVD